MVSPDRKSKKRGKKINLPVFSRREGLGERTLLGEGRSSSGARGRCSAEAMTCRQGGSEGEVRWTRKFRFRVPKRAQ